MNDKELPSNKKDLLEDLDLSLEKFLGKELVEDINEAIDCFEADKKNAIDDLDQRLDTFLSGNYDIAKLNEYKGENSLANQEIETQETQKKLPEKDHEYIKYEKDQEQSFRNIKIEKELINLKSLTKQKTNGLEGKVPPSRSFPETTDKEADQQVEKEFAKKEIEKALEELKAKSSSIKGKTILSSAEITQEKAIITDDEVKNSLQSFLKKMD